MSDEIIGASEAPMPPEPPPDISGASYTLSEALAGDETLKGCLPCPGLLVGFAYIGHGVLVFEGHSAASSGCSSAPPGWAGFTTSRRAGRSPRGSSRGKGRGLVSFTLALSTDSEGGKQFRVERC
jgi:hypothetical protein